MVQPVVTSVDVPADKTYKVGEVLTFTVHYDQVVTLVLPTPYLPLTFDGNPTRTAFYQSGSGSTDLVFNYTVVAGDDDLTGITVGGINTNGGTVAFQNAGNEAVNLNLNGLPSLTNVKVDGKSPFTGLVTLTKPGGTSLNATTTSVNYTVLFPEGVTGVDTSDFTLTTSGTATGTISNVTKVANDQYTVTVNALAGTGQLRLNLKGDTGNTGIKDLYDNALSGSDVTNGTTLTLDMDVPTVTLNRAAASPTNATTLKWNVVFSEDVTGVDVADFTVSGSGVTYDALAAGNFTKIDAKTYEVTLTNVGGDGTAQLKLNAAPGTNIKDAAGNFAAATDGQTYTIDRTAPTVTSLNTATGSPNNGSTASWTLTMSEAVTGVDAADFTLVKGGTTAGTIGTPTTSNGGVTWTIPVTGITGDGTLGLNLNNTGTGIADLLPNALADGGKTGGTVDFDHTAPTVTSVVVPANGVYNTGQTLTFKVNFSENVLIDVKNAPSVALTTEGGGTVSADYVAGSGSTQLTFGYTVKAADVDVNGIAVGANLVNSKFVVDAAGNQAAPALTGLPSTGNILVNYSPTPTPNPTPPAPAPVLTPAAQQVQNGGIANILQIPTNPPPPATITLSNGTVVENPLVTQQKQVAAIMAQVSAGTLTLDQATKQIVHLADGTTSVATLSYSFFTGKMPTKDGLGFLVTSSSNPTDLNDPYYLQFSDENRYINFAVNLGKGGEGSAQFNADYGSLNLNDALSKAYAKIFGFTPTAAKITDILNAPVTTGGQTMTRAQYFATFGLDGPNGIGTKAAAVGYLLGEAMKNDLGPLATANALFLQDTLDGTAAYGTDLTIYLPSTYVPIPFG